MVRSSVVIFFLILCFNAKAQLYTTAYQIGWNTLIPLSDKDYISQTSTAGFRVGFTKFVNDRVGFGFEGGYSTLHDYVPRQTYEYQGGAYTTDFYNYHYYFSLIANGQYYFAQGKNFMPFASLGMGVAFSEYRIFYNVYEESDSPTGFLVRPEVGTFFRFKEYSSWGLKASLSYDFATNKSESLDIGNFSAVGIQIGVVLFGD